MSGNILLYEWLVDLISIWLIIIFLKKDLKGLNDLWWQKNPKNGVIWKSVVFIRLVNRNNAFVWFNIDEGRISFGVLTLF